MITANCVVERVNVNDCVVVVVSRTELRYLYVRWVCSASRSATWSSHFTTHGHTHTPAQSIIMDYFFIMLIVPWYTKKWKNAEKTHTKKRKRERERKTNKQTKENKQTPRKKHLKTPHMVHYIVHSRLYIWTRKPTGQCCLAISNKYTLKQYFCKELLAINLTTAKLCFF